MMESSLAIFLGTMRRLYQDWINAWEDRLSSRDTNRVVRPLDWGVDWTRHWPGANGNCPVDDLAAAELFLHELNRSALGDSDRFFAYEAPRDFRIERNGNGRDVDIIPVLAGTYAHGYTLTFEIIADTGVPRLLYTTGSYLDEKSNLNYYVPSAAIRERFPAFALNRSYAVRATVTLDVGFGGQSGYWSPAFIERVFPMRERTKSITKQVVF